MENGTVESLEEALKNHPDIKEFIELFDDSPFVAEGSDPDSGNDYVIFTSVDSSKSFTLVKTANGYDMSISRN